MSDKPVKRRWFQYRLRTLFVVVTVACLIAGWSAYQNNWIRQRHEFLANYEEIWHDLGFPAARPRVETQFWAPGLIWLFGESGVKELGITIITENAPDRPVEAEPEFQRAKRLFPEAKIVAFQQSRAEAQRMARYLENMKRSRPPSRSP